MTSVSYLLQKKLAATIGSSCQHRRRTLKQDCACACASEIHPGPRLCYVATLASSFFRDQSIEISWDYVRVVWCSLYQWIGFHGKIWENWNQFKPYSFLHGKIYGFRLRFSHQNQSIDCSVMARTDELPNCSFSTYQHISALCMLRCSGFVCQG